MASSADSETEDQEVLAGGAAPEEKQHRLVAARFQGPLPPPSLLEHYKDIQPDFPERILKLTEEEAQHRRDYNNRVLAATRWETTLGQVFGLMVAIAAFGTAAYLAFLGHPTAAGWFGATTVIGLVAVFVQGRSRSSDGRNLDEYDPDQGPSAD